MNGGGSGDGLVRCPVRAFDGRDFSETTADIVCEMPLMIFLNGRHIVTTACTGLHVEELALGFLRSEGLIRSAAEIRDIQTAPDRSTVRIDATTTEGPAHSNTPAGKTIASSGSRGSGEDSSATPPEPAGTETLSLRPDQVLDLMEKFLDVTHLHRITRGTHCAALADGGNILVSREDIGRHNALDMLAGHALLHGVDCRDKIVLRTGRVSFEIVQKVRQMGTPVVVSLAVPTSLAIQMAVKAGITLIGAVRGRTFKLYTHERRMGL
jgi:FdhD protein